MAVHYSVYSTQCVAIITVRIFNQTTHLNRLECPIESQLTAISPAHWVYPLSNNIAIYCSMQSSHSTESYPHDLAHIVIHTVCKCSSGVKINVVCVLLSRTERVSQKRAKSVRTKVDDCSQSGARIRPIARQVF